MKRFLNAGIFCLGVLAISFPTYSYSKSIAFSPSLPGQPLIFNKSSPSHLFDRKTFKRLSPKQTEKLFDLSQLSVRLSTNINGLVEIFFLPIDAGQKQSLIIRYNEDINETISLIDKEFLAIKGHFSKRLAKLIHHTLITLTQLTNEMLVNITMGNIEEFQQDYLQMQIQVINAYKEGISKILKNHDKLSSAEEEAENGLEGLVSTLSLYITNMDELINGSNSVSKSLVQAPQQIIENLTQFIDFNFFILIMNISQKNEKNHEKHC